MPVTLLEPSNPVFEAPNRITLKDFAGWVEQRGSKFWSTGDPACQPLVETHDTGGWCLRLLRLRVVPAASVRRAGRCLRIWFRWECGDGRAAQSAALSVRRWTTGQPNRRPHL